MKAWEGAIYLVFNSILICFLMQGIVTGNSTTEQSSAITTLSADITGTSTESPMTTEDSSATASSQGTTTANETSSSSTGVTLSVTSSSASTAPETVSTTSASVSASVSSNAESSSVSLQSTTSSQAATTESTVSGNADTSASVLSTTAEPTTQTTSVATGTVTEASSVSTIGTEASTLTSVTTIRPTLSVSVTLRPFWCTVGLQVATTVDVNTTAYIYNMEDRLAIAYNEALIIYTANQRSGKRRKKRAATQGNVALQVINMTRVGNTERVNAVFIVQQSGNFVSASQVASVMQLLSNERLSIILNTPVVSQVTALDTTIAPTVDTQAWIIGAVLGTLGAIVLIVWLVLFIYARCLRPQPPPLLDVETPSEVTFSSPAENRKIIYAESGLDDGVQSENTTKSRQETALDDGEKVNNLDITLLADAVARRLDKKVSRIVDRKLDSRTESMRERSAAMLSPSEEDSYTEEASVTLQSSRPPKHGRRRKSKINSISPSEDDYRFYTDSLSLPPLRRPSRNDCLSEEDEETERRRRRRARQKVARDLDRALGDDVDERKKGKSKRRRRGREEGKEINEEALKETRNKMTELLSEPYPVTGTSGDVIEAQSTGNLEETPQRNSDQDGEVLEPLPGPHDNGHKPIRVLSSLRPEALHTASLSSTYKTADEMEKIRPEMEKDLETHSEVLLDVRGATPVYIRSPVPGSGDARSTPQGAFRPIAAATTSRHPGAPLSPDADETDIAAATDPTTPKPLIDSIREELQRLTTTNSSVA